MNVFVQERKGWKIKDFVDHYEDGGGRGVTLIQIGLLERFKNSTSVLRQRRKWREINLARAEAVAIGMMRANIFSKKPEIASPIFQAKDRSLTDVTLDGQLFPIGQSTFFMKARWKVYIRPSKLDFRYEGILGFSIRDEFRDPTDLEKYVGRPIETGTPYDIHADWSEPFEGQGEFQ